MVTIITLIGVKEKLKAIKKIEKEYRKFLEIPISVEVKTI